MLLYFWDSLGNYITLDSAHVNLSNTDLLIADAHIPGVSIGVTPPKNARLLASLKLIDSKERLIRKKGKNILVFDTLKRVFPLYNFHLMYSIFHFNWIKQGVYAIHAACVYNRGKTILLMGHTGFGKTTLSLELVKKYGFKLIHSDRVLVKFAGSRLMLIGGTKVVTFKKDNDKIHRGMLNRIDSYIDRYIGPLKDEFLLEKKDVYIDKVSLVRLNGGLQESTSLNQFESLICFYPFFLDAVNSDAILFQGKSIFSGIPCKSGHKESLLSDLVHFTKKVRVHKLSGSLKFICNELIQYE